MVKNDGTMEIQQQEDFPTGEMERTRSRRVFIPKTDIFETENEIIVLADIPGANGKTVDITLEKNVLSIIAYIEPNRTTGLDIAYAEYEEGDYQRSFRLSDEIDRIARFVLAAILTLLYFTGTVSGAFGIALLVLAAVFALTAAVNFCPLYLPFKLSTTGK